MALSPFAVVLEAIRLVVDWLFVTILVVRSFVVLITVMGLVGSVLRGDVVGVVSVLFVVRCFVMGNAVLTSVVALKMVVLWGVGGEGLVMGLVVGRGAVLAVLVPLNGLVMDGNLVGGVVVLLLVVNWLVLSVVRFEVVEFLLMDGHVVLRVGGVMGWHLVLPVLVVVIASVVTVVSNTVMVRLVVVTVVRAVVLALTGVVPVSYTHLTLPTNREV